MMVMLEMVVVVSDGGCARVGQKNQYLEEHHQHQQHVESYCG